MWILVLVHRMVEGGGEQYAGGMCGRVWMVAPLYAEFSNTPDGLGHVREGWGRGQGEGPPLLNQNTNTELGK
jgi:hypothetical protein